MIGARSDAIFNGNQDAVTNSVGGGSRSVSEVVNALGSASVILNGAIDFDVPVGGGLVMFEFTERHRLGASTDSVLVQSFVAAYADFEIFELTSDVPTAVFAHTFDTGAASPKLASTAT